MIIMKLSRVDGEISIRLEKLDTELASDLVVSGLFRLLFCPGRPEKIIGNDHGRRLHPNCTNFDFTINFSFFLFFNNSFKIYDRG
jgi:hypothetical protein